MNGKTRLAVTLTGALLALALLLTYCVPPTPTPAPPGETTFSCEPGSAYKPGEILATNPYYVLGQVILSGGSQSVSRMVEALAQREIPLELYEGCQLSAPQQLPAAERPGEPPLPVGFEAGEGLSPFYDQGQGRVVIPGGQALAVNLYQIGGGRSVEEAVQAIAAIRQEQPELAVYADPNYLTGHLAGSPCSHPFGVEGSPFGVEGSPFGVEGSPAGGQGIPAQAGDFWEQWAFKEIGLPSPEEPASDLNGEGVQVAVFDTSPFSVSSAPDGTGDATEAIAIIDPPLELNIHHPFALPGLAVSSKVTHTVNVKDHGLFVAGLVHAVATQSEIHLYRVLDDSGCGDLQLLVKALLRYAVERGGKGERGRSVVNMSLGIQKPRRLDEAGLAKAKEEIASKDASVAAAYEMASSELAIEALQLAVELAHQSGAVIVAAAGNDSVQGILQLESDVPAASPFALGVSASGPGGEPACYSNKGDIVAPGGQADLDASEDGNPDTVPHCIPMAEACPETQPGPGCSYGLISLTTTLEPGAAGPYGYSYWVGTSFATPLVSGAAARHYQATSQADVYSRILGEAASLANPLLAPGLIQVPSP